MANAVDWFVDCTECASLVRSSFEKDRFEPICSSVSVYTGSIRGMYTDMTFARLNAPICSATHWAVGF